MAKTLKIKKGKKKEEPAAPPVRAKRLAPVPKEPWAWIRGLTISERNVESWTPLYCFRWPTDRMRARGTLRRILEMDDMPRELADYEDFDLHLPEGYDSGAQDEPLEASQSAPKPSRVSEPSPPQESASERPSKGKKKRKRCRDVYDAHPGDRCIKKRGHDMPHRDLAGHEWEDD